MPIRLGAVSFLNARPLVQGLDHQPERFSIRFDVPSRCADLLHANDVDLGLIPSIEYLHDPDYLIIPGVSISSDGPVASVSLFSSRPISDVASIAVDTSSRTSVALLRILCARWFEIAPSFAEMSPDLSSMLQKCDAALIIGDKALFPDAGRAGIETIDLGEEWMGMTGLPFVYAFWAGRPGAAGPDDVARLQESRDKGIAAAADIARQSFPSNPDKAARATSYLLENINYPLSEREADGLRRFYELAAETGVVPASTQPRFYDSR